MIIDYKKRNKVGESTTYNQTITVSKNEALLYGLTTERLQFLTLKQLDAFIRKVHTENFGKLPKRLKFMNTLVVVATEKEFKKLKIKI